MTRGCRRDVAKGCNERHRAASATAPRHQTAPRVRQMASIAVTPAEHQVFTNAWRAAIPYGQGTKGATVEQVLAVARSIYSNYPAILQGLGW